MYTTDLTLFDFIIQHDATAARILTKNTEPCSGDLVGVRLNLNILKTSGVAVQSIHRGTNSSGYKANKGFFRGEVIHYAKAVRLKDAYFNVDQVARDKIASGVDHKSAMASVDGEFVSTSDHYPTASIEIRFNPKLVHLFVDSMNRAVRYAEHVVVIGHRAYAFGNVEYYTESNSPIKCGNVPSCAIVMKDNIHSK